MENYLDLIEIMDFPVNFEVSYAYGWVNPEHIAKTLISLGDFDGFYKMPEYFTNYRYLSGNLIKNPITVPIISFDKSLFINNKDITDLVLSRYLCSIPQGAFINMKNLKRIWLPKRITYIPKECFMGCDSLEEIYYEGTEDEFNQIEIYHKLYRVIPKNGIHNDIEIYYDDGNLPFIKAKVYFNQIRIKEIEVKEGFVRIGRKNITNKKERWLK